MNPVTWALEHLSLVLTGTLALVLLAWAAESYLEADDRREALDGFGARAKRGTGGVLNVVLVSLVAIIGGAVQATGSVGELVAWTAGMIPDGPVIAASTFAIGLGGLGLSDWLSLHPLQYIGIAGIVLVVAIAWRADLS